VTKAPLAIVLLLGSSAIATAGSLQWAPAGPYPTKSSCQPISFDQPDAVAIDQSGDVYVGNESGANALQEVTADGAIHTILDRRVEPIKSGHYFGLSLAINRNGTVFLGVEQRGTVERLNPDGTLTIIAGKPGERALVDGPASKARLKSPKALAIGPRAMYVVDTRTIRRINQDGSIRTLAGNAHAKDPHPLTGGSAYFVNGLESHAVFMSLNGVAVSALGDLYVTDAYDGEVDGQATIIGLIRKLTPYGFASTLAGNMDTIGSDADGSGTSATFTYLFGITIGHKGDLYVTEPYGYSSIRKVTADGDVSTVVSTKVISFSTTGLLAPTGIAVDPKGTLYVVDDLEITGISGKHLDWLHRVVRKRLETLCQNMPASK
jgi:DNA-binding beta-propeller fold protein YncE